VVVDPAGLASPICRDPDDDIVLATAVAGNCGCIITGDKDLLVLQRFSGVDIVSPGDFLEYEATH
ncbi:MAG: putative toxin-antitoxin system toxin component, PIN family, partial [Gammaproteobacteria bacterium]